VGGREKILRVHMRKVPLAPDVDPKVIARGTPGFSGADLANLVNEAALLAARRNKRLVTQAEFEDSKDKVMMGAERRSMIMTEEEKLATAYHEGGHALVNILVPGNDPLHKVTIIPRGRALGVTQHLPAEDRLSLSLVAANDQIARMMGGRLAEEVIFGQITTGAANDIQQATDMARRMVCEWGMSVKMGPLHFGKREGEVFLGRDFGDTSKDYSEQTAVDIDAEIHAIVSTNYDRAKKVLVENLEKLKLLAEALLEYETIDGREIDIIFSGQKLERKVTPPTAEKATPAPKAAEKPPRPSIFAPPRPVPDKA
jgi:cell division protease FtsH